MKKTARILPAILTFMLIFAPCVMAASNVTYTFTANKVITDGSPNDITDAKLTKDITVTTSGNMNRKYVGITDLKHNNEVGTFPANDSFKAIGSYLYLGTANANDGAIITLQIPEIKAGSKVTLTFAKPTVTNNGSTLRNTNDPYAYLKIADRYISINGDNFDTWRTESVVTGEDTSEIVFYADKWGAVAISKIEIKEGDNTPLHSVNIASTQYANLIVNGIKFCADENGKITLPSYEKGDEISITAYKDGYETKEMTQTMPDKDIDISIPLDCTVDAAYYESDFGSADGTLALDGEYKFSDGITTEDITAVSGYITFADGGYVDINTDNGSAARIRYNNGKIYIDDKEITPKDNMEFVLYLDKTNNIISVKENGRYRQIERLKNDFNTVISVSGQNVQIEYIGISYVDGEKAEVTGPDRIYSLADRDTVVYWYDLKAEYTPYLHGESEYSVEGIDGATEEYSMIKIPSGASGTLRITITQEYHDYTKYAGSKTAYKDVEVIPNPKIVKWQHDDTTMNLNSSKQFEVYDLEDEYGNRIDFLQYDIGDTRHPTRYNCLRDYKSSDENVIRIDQNGKMTAVGKGKATITANAYTGTDNIISVEYTVDSYYIDGVTEDDVSYSSGDIIENDNINKYVVTYEDGSEEDAEFADIPSATVTADGIAVTAYYNNEGKLRSIKNDRVKTGDKLPVSNGLKRVYLLSGENISEIKDADTVMRGFKINHEKGVRYEIAPVYKFTDLGDVAEGNTLNEVFPSGYYTLDFKKAETKRGDIFVNGYMVGNNVDQCDADRKLTEGSRYTADDIKIKNGSITVSMTDGSTLLDSVIVKKKPEFYQRLLRVYVIGDSLACNYYGDFEQEVGGGRTGWGQLLGNYINAPITNLANSGQFAKGLYETAFPSVIENGEEYDICLIECGYNDRSYSTRDEMINTVKAMVNECENKFITPILITPNASAHDYKPSVSWSSYLKNAAIDTRCPLIDLSQLSYDFLYSLYGDDADGSITKTYNLTEVGGDNLHSSYAAAQKWASVVAQELKNYGSYGSEMFNAYWKIKHGQGEFFNTDYEYTFTDTLGNKITCKIE